MPTPRLPLAGAALAALTLVAAAPAAGPPSTAAAAAPPRAAAAVRWGDVGHRLVGEAAAGALPAGLPAFFRQAAGQLAWLNYEPDRWRAPRDAATLDAAMDPAYAPDHFVDLELLPATALQARDRYAYADSLRAAGIDPATAGLLPWRILELTSRLREGFRQWRAATDPAERRWIEARLVNDAGILGHYVADGANPHHTSIHYNGWTGANPQGYPTDRRTHARFESQFVGARLTLADVRPLVAPAPTVRLPLREGVTTYLLATHAQLERLYTLDRAEAFGPTTAGADHRRFAAERLAAGATMLRDLWWTAWTASAPGAAAGGEADGAGDGGGPR